MKSSRDVLRRLLVGKDPRVEDDQNETEAQRAQADRAIQETVRFGPMLLPLAEQAQHLAAVGSTGSGKTTLLRLAMQDIVPAIAPGSDSRAIIYNAKQDLLPNLAAMAPKTPVANLDPFDARGIAWDMARDVTDAATAIQLAYILMEPRNESQPFFSDACRHLMYGVLLSYTVRKIDWTLADLLRAFSSERNLRRVLRACVYTRQMVAQYFGDKRVVANILSTFASRMMLFEPVAAAWEHAELRVSLKDWIENEFVIVLGNSEKSKEAVNTLNRCIFQVATNMTLDLKDSSVRRSWFILDELPELGRLGGLLSLCKKGRSKGACVVMAFQSIAGMRSEKLYGKDEAAEILDQVGHISIGRVGLETAEWGCQLIGEQDVEETSTGGSYGYASGSFSSTTTYNTTIKTQKTVMASELMDITPCSYNTGLEAFYLSRMEEGVVKAKLDGSTLFDRDLKAPDNRTADFMPIPAKKQLYAPWSARRAEKCAPRPKRRSKRASRERGTRPVKTRQHPSIQDLTDAMDDLS